MKNEDQHQRHTLDSPVTSWCTLACNLNRGTFLKVDRMERLDIKGKFKTFISDSKLKLLSPGNGAAGPDGDDWQLILPQVSWRYGYSNIWLFFICLLTPRLLQGTASLDRGDWSDSDREVGCILNMICQVSSTARLNHKAKLVIAR